LKNPTVREALNSAVEKLGGAGVDGPAHDAEFLITHLLKVKRHELFLNPERELTDKEAARFESFIERRCCREPAQLITGECEFRSLTFRVTGDVLVPRPETEILIDEALKKAAAFDRTAPLIAIDLCTGSGCIAVAFAKEAPLWRVCATDISPAALKIAEENAIRNEVADRIKFIEGDLFAPLDNIKASLVLSNPPYVTAAEMKELEPEVREWEPAAALYGGEDGLDFYRRIIAEAGAHLLPGGFLVMEIGWGQARAIRGLLEKEGRFIDIKIRKDYAGIERVVAARLKPE